MSDVDTSSTETTRRYLRFSFSDRIEHWIQFVAFTGLAITGLLQLFSEGWLARFFIGLLGGINFTRFIHRSFGLVVIVAAVYHLGTAGYRFFVLRTGKQMLPDLGDVKAAAHSVAYNLGFRNSPAREGRFTFAEKMEYWSIVWGTILMAVTGLMMWNPIATTAILPGEFIPAAKAAHAAEAVLAVLAILIWHFYFVHVRHFNRSMLDGYIDESQMRDEHPLELEELEAGALPKSTPESVLRRRRRWFFPAYAVAVLAIGVAVFLFLNYQEVAIETVPPLDSTVEIYVPYVPLSPAEATDAYSAPVVP